MKPRPLNWVETTIRRSELLPAARCDQRAAFHFNREMSNRSLRSLFGVDALHRSAQQLPRPLRCPCAGPTLVPYCHIHVHRQKTLRKIYALKVTSALMPIASRISCSRDIATVWYSVSS